MAFGFGLKTPGGNLVSHFYCTRLEALDRLRNYLSFVGELSDLENWKVVKVEIKEVEEK